MGNPGRTSTAAIQPRPRKRRGEHRVRIDKAASAVTFSSATAIIAAYGLMYQDAILLLIAVQTVSGIILHKICEEEVTRE